MQKCLYLLCPTDCLELVINNTYRGENYFYTSLGNSVELNNETLNKIESLIIQHDFKKIFFVLSDQNNIIKDALGNQKFLDVRGLNRFYKDIVKQKENSRMLSVVDYNQFSILSYYLNSKIKELQWGLKETTRANSIKINGKIYNSFKKTFQNIYPELICLERPQLN